MLNIILGLCVVFSLCILAGAIFALIETDKALGKAIRFEIPPWRE